MPSFGTTAHENLCLTKPNKNRLDSDRPSHGGQLNQRQVRKFGGFDARPNIVGANDMRSL